MTTEQALIEAQARVESFKEQAKEWMTSPHLRSQAIATIAIDTEIKTVESLMKLSTYNYTIGGKIADLQLIKEQIPNTL